jgi:hypothetical protein
VFHDLLRDHDRILARHGAGLGAAAAGGGEAKTSITVCHPHAGSPPASGENPTVASATGCPSSSTVPSTNATAGPDLPQPADTSAAKKSNPKGSMGKEGSADRRTDCRFALSPT